MNGNDAAVLEPPSLRVVPSYVAALREGFTMSIEAPTLEVEIRAIEADPHGFLDSWFAPKGETFTAPDGTQFPRVPSDDLWLVRGGKHFCGELSLRHRLNAFGEAFGGHVGYGIRPSCRGQGLGTRVLTLARRRAAEMGIDTLQVNCRPDNAASQRVIAKNGGTFRDEGPAPFGYGGRFRRYWVPAAGA